MDIQEIQQLAHQRQEYDLEEILEDCESPKEPTRLERLVIRKYHEITERCGLL